MSNFDENSREDETSFGDMPPNFDIPIYDGQNNEMGDYTEEEREKIDAGYEPKIQEELLPDPGSLETQFGHVGTTEAWNTQFEQQQPMKKTGAKIIVVIVALLIMAAVALSISAGSLLFSYFKSDKLVETELESESESELEVVDEYELVEPIYAYIEEGEDGELEKYIKNNKYALNLNYMDDERYSPLYYAIIYENVSAVDILLRHGADVELTDEEADYESPLFMAIEYADFEVIKMLLSYGANINATNQYGGTPLLYATHMSVSEYMYLVANGADTTAVDYDGWNILHYAACYGTEEMYNVCLKLGEGLFDEYARTEDGYSVAHLAVAGSNISLLQILLDKGLPMELQLENGNTLLHLVTADDMAHFIMDNYECDYNALNRRNATPLHWVAYRELSPDVLQRYIDNGADVNAQDIDGVTPLMNAVPVKENVQLLIDNGADVSMKDNNGYTASDYVPNGIGSEYLKNLLRVR